MAISKDDVQLCICKLIKISMNSGWNVAKNHPFISFTLLFFSFLYACFSWFFWALIHLLAFLILVVSITRIYSTSLTKNSPPNNNTNGSVDTSKQYTLNVRNGKTIIRAQSVRQRKSGETIRNSPQDDKIKNNMVDKSPLAEENPKEIEEVKIQSFQESESSEEDEKEREEKIHKAVQWTEDDEKNLMDLGFSEIERNKRLESLIAKRSAKKQLSLQIRKTVLNTDTNHIAPIDIPNNKPFSQIDQLSPTPGSAPSVMLPAYNPFGLPHDPQEEKPVLAPDRKDNALFCRHVSFSLGNPQPMDFKEDHNHTAQEGLDNSDTEGKEKDIDKVIEIESCESPKSKLKNMKADDDCMSEDIQNIEETKHVVMHHKPTNSIASDLQVEFSEVGSPPQTIDGSISSLDVGSPIEAEEEDMTYGNEATWEISSQPSRNDDAHSKLKEIHKLHEENLMKLGFSTGEESKDILLPLPLPLQLDKNIKDHHFTHSLSRTPSKEELLSSPHHQHHIPALQSSQSQSESPKSGISAFENVQQSTETQNDASKVPKDAQTQSPLDELISIEDKNTVQSTEANDEDRFSGINASFSDQALVLHPTPVLQEISMSTEISSPRSVLQPKLSTDRSSLSIAAEDMNAEIQQMYTQIVENNMPEEGTTVLRENSTSPPPLLDGLEAKQSQESSHPSSSAMQDSSLQFESKTTVAEDEITQNETREIEIPECTPEKINSPIALVDLQKPVQETNPSTLDEMNDTSDGDFKHQVSPTRANPNEQLNETTQLINMEEPSHVSKSLTEDERREDKAMEIPESTATRMSNENMIEDPQKLIEGETNSSTLDNNTIDK